MERRVSHRIPTDLFLTEYVDDRPARLYAGNISDRGLHVARVMGPFRRRSPLVQVEFRLPGTSDTIWAGAEVRYDSLDEYFHTSGLHLRAMADGHARRLRDYVLDLRAARLKAMLERVRARRARMQPH